MRFRPIRATTRASACKTCADQLSKASTYRYRHGASSPISIASAVSPVALSPPVELVYDFTAEAGTNVTANCSAFSSNGIADVTCPLSYIAFGRKSTHYSLLCGSSLTLLSEIDRLRTVMIAFGFIGFVECLLVAILTACNPSLRHWPGTKAMRIRSSLFPTSPCLCRRASDCNSDWPSCARVGNSPERFWICDTNTLQPHSWLSTSMPLARLPRPCRHSWNRFYVPHMTQPRSSSHIL